VLRVDGGEVETFFHRRPRRFVEVKIPTLSQKRDKGGAVGETQVR